ncbi:hypothetical protein BU16DRAFT_618260 [Lophium mytilinum]|uniref:Uncharacterized protein n=1 Tax=Lophium mytilinum TaxID=390894 RepID=A0A6A6QTL7_9PEZI|nr:hypothetical protein BU16DRAFT_618260 [Lophium mytilinum]
MSLVPIEPAFSQHGTVDWTNLAQIPFNTSMAILGRLADAGLQPLTVAMAQAMGHCLPISVAGEKKLKEAVSSCKAFSSFGTMLWFGIGVRHILRTMVDTSQGASSVALVACLAEGFGPERAAKVLYEMAKLVRVPSNLSPSYDQWVQYAEVCSGLLATSTFGLEVHQLSKLSNYAIPASANHSRDGVSDPDIVNNDTVVRELAEFLVLIGRIQRKELDAVEVLSGPIGIWAAKFCDSFLGLRVVVYSCDGRDIFQNYNTSTETPQIVFQNTPRLERKSRLSLISRVTSLKLGEFVRIGTSHPGRQGDMFFPYSRVRWDNILQGCYGFDALTAFKSEKNGKLQPFAHLFATYALLFHDYLEFPYLTRVKSATSILHQLCKVVPELRCLVPGAEAEIRRIEEQFGSPERITSPEQMIERRLRSPELTNIVRLRGVYFKGPRITEVRSVYAKASRCVHQSCHRFHDGFTGHSGKCLHEECRPGQHGRRDCRAVSLFFTLVLIADLFTNAAFDDDEESEICLSHTGVDLFHNTVTSVLAECGEFPVEGLILLTKASHKYSRRILEGLPEDPRLLNDASLFGTHFELLSGFQASPSNLFSRGGISAMSSSGFVCYVDFLRDPFQSELDCGPVHIARGSIQWEDRTYRMVEDGRSSKSSRPCPTGVKTVAQHQARALVEDKSTSCTSNGMRLLLKTYGKSSQSCPYTADG